jgi:hypothetical protein
MRRCALRLAIMLDRISIALNRLAERLARYAAGGREDKPCRGTTD